MYFIHKSPIFIVSFFVLIPVNLPATNEIEQVFTQIYDQKIWGSDGQGNGSSGWGSMAKAAAPYMNFLTHFLKQYNITSVVDVGCGDWSFSQYIDWTGISYVGYDVVSTVIERNKKKFQQSNCIFIHGDATKTELPSADLLLCKDVLQHLSNESIATFLKQCDKFKYCLITNDINKNANTNIADGLHRPLDLTKAPFFVPGTKIFTYMGAPEKEVLLIIQSTI